ncbi:MAG: hypothetical protein KAS04_06600 [Candidatus Aenigmarchaeota archaeon]|nr:hypothetical protein [Candidatus Aenigmarchaeota archaeon]
MIKKKIFKQEKKGESTTECKTKWCTSGNETGGCFYFLGFIGALIYYITTAPSFLDAVIGFFKAIFWPVFLIHGLLLLVGA